MRSLAINVNNGSAYNFVVINLCLYACFTNDITLNFFLPDLFMLSKAQNIYLFIYLFHLFIIINHILIIIIIHLELVILSFFFHYYFIIYLTFDNVFDL